MSSTPTHEEVEARFRALVEEADLPPPDDVGYEPDGVMFRWREQKLVVFVDFDDEVTQCRGSAAPRPP